MNLKAFNTVSRYILNFETAAIPLQAYYIITTECNLKCKSCSFWKGIYRKENKDILDTQGSKALIQKISELKIPSLVISGGEPFLRKDLLEILEYSVARVKHVRVQTNGTLLTSKDAERLVRIGLDELWFSIDGSEATHDWLRGQRGSFKKTTEALECIGYFKKKHKSLFPNIIMNIVLSRHNMHQIMYLLDLARQYDVGEFFLNYISDIRQESILKTQESLNRDDICSCQFTSGASLTAKDHMISKGLLREIEVFRRKTKKVVSIDPLLRNGKDILPRIKCVFIWSNIMISPYGEVLVCPMIDKLVMGDLMQNRLMDVWNSEAFKKLRRAASMKKIAVCEDCCCKRRTILDHFRDPHNFKRIFLSKQQRAFTYKMRMGI